MHEVPKKSVEQLLEEQNETLMALFVQVSRIYDVLGMSNARKEGVEKLLMEHEEGYLVGPPPELKAFKDPQEDQDAG